MVKKIISIILILLGLSVLGLGIGSGTIWKPEDSVTLKTGELDKALLVATNPGVVHQVNSNFEMTVTAPGGGDVALVVGNTVDVAGWIGNDAHWLVTGATDWEKLNTEFVAEKADPDAKPEDTEPDPAAEDTPAVSPIANLAKSDMWYQVVEGKGTVTLTMDKVPDNVIFLAGSLDPEATDAPQISLTWEREVPTPLMLPGILAGALLLAIGVLLLIDSLRHTPDWTEVEAQAILAGTRGSKKSDLELSSETALSTTEADDAENPSEVVAAWDGGSGTANEPTDGELAASNAAAGSAASSFAPKGAALESAVDEDEEPDYSDVTVLDTSETNADDFSSDEGSIDKLDAEGSDLVVLDTNQLDTDDEDSEFEEFTFTPVTLDFADQGDAALETEPAAGDTDQDAESEEVLAPDELLIPAEPAESDDTPEPESWFGRLFGKKAKAPKPVRALTPLEALPTTDGDAEFAVPSGPFGAVSDQGLATPTEPDHETQAALEVFAAMDEPDVTTGALQAAGLTRRQLREMRERKEQDAQRNVPSTTGSLDFGPPPALAPERPSWLPEGADSTSASSWRAAWGVRPEGSAAAASSVPAPPPEDTDGPEFDGSDTAATDTAATDTAATDTAATDTAATDTAATDTAATESGTPDAAPAPSSNDGVEPETDASTQKATARPTTRRALYSAYREAAERIANEDAEQEQTK